jgi:hypothetical protein
MLIRRPDSVRGSDLYETPEVATVAPVPRARQLAYEHWQI